MIPDSRNLNGIFTLLALGNKKKGRSSELILMVKRELIVVSMSSILYSSHSSSSCRNISYLYLIFCSTLDIFNTGHEKFMLAQLYD